VMVLLTSLWVEYCTYFEEELSVGGMNFLLF